MNASVAIVACANHPGREAIGVCVRCRRRVCGECTTKVDGINHCVTCFAELAAEHKKPEARLQKEGEWSRAFFTAVALAIAVVIAWGVLEVMMPGGT